MPMDSGILWTAVYYGLCDDDRGGNCRGTQYMDCLGRTGRSALDELLYSVAERARE